MNDMTDDEKAYWLGFQAGYNQGIRDRYEQDGPYPRKVDTSGMVDEPFYFPSTEQTEYQKRGTASATSCSVPPYRVGKNDR